MIRTLTTALLATSALAQTYTTCNPLTQTCKPDPALGGAKQFDFTSEQPDWHVSFKPDRIEYSPEGVSLRVQTQGDNPTLQSDFYLMFGRVEAVIQAAPGVGIVSSFVLQSDDLDEIDLEWLGGDNTQVQTNFFVKGNTDTYDRGQFHGIGNPTGMFHTYTIEWTAEQITWSINGAVIRTLLSNDYHGFPQSPMNLRMGVWAGGDPSNNAGTIQWAGGATNYAAGPYPMIIKSVNVEDYSSGDAYEYTDMSGTWQSIKAHNGEVHPVRPAVIAPADGSNFDLISAEQGEKPTEVKSASSAPATSSIEASSSAPVSSSSAAAPSSAAPSSAAPSSAAPSSAAPSSAAPVSSSSVAPVSSSAASSPAAVETPKTTKSIPAAVVPAPHVNTTSAAQVNTTTVVASSSISNKTTSTVFATVTSCKDDACKPTSHSQVPVVNLTTEAKPSTTKAATVLPVTPVTKATESATSAQVSQATGSTSAHQANGGVVTEASFGAVVVAAFALMLI